MENAFTLTKNMLMYIFLSLRQTEKDFFFAIYKVEKKYHSTKTSVIKHVYFTFIFVYCLVLKYW